MTVRLTWAEREALRYLVEMGRTRDLTGVSLEGMYERRWRGREGHTWAPSQAKRGAWRRNGGRVLASLRRKGMAEYVMREELTYRLTAKGIEQGTTGGDDAEP